MTVTSTLESSRALSVSESINVQANIGPTAAPSTEDATDREPAPQAPGQIAPKGLNGFITSSFNQFLNAANEAARGLDAPAPSFRPGNPFAREGLAAPDSETELSFSLDYALEFESNLFFEQSTDADDDGEEDERFEFFQDQTLSLAYSEFREQTADGSDFEQNLSFSAFTSNRATIERDGQSFTSEFSVELNFEISLTQSFNEADGTSSFFFAVEQSIEVGVFFESSTSADRDDDDPDALEDAPDLGTDGTASINLFATAEQTSETNVTATGVPFETDANNPLGRPIEPLSDPVTLESLTEGEVSFELAYTASIADQLQSFSESLELSVSGTFQRSSFIGVNTDGDDGRSRIQAFLEAQRTARLEESRSISLSVA